MSNVSIFEKKWIDLIFEGKNKAYGAYKLRQESPRTTLTAFIAGLFFIGSISGLGLFLSSFDDHPTVIPTKDEDRIIKVENIHPPVDEPKHPESFPHTQAVPPVVNNQHYIPAPTPEAQPEIPETPANPTNGQPGGEPGGTGPVISNPVPGGGGGNEGGNPPSGPVMNVLLDVQPEYPGGIKKFYEYVGRNFEKPNLEDVETVTVNVSFVIEKDGSMTDIKVLRNPGYGLDKEAIRVLKSLKTKWTPGVKDGQYVRTQYTLPIKVQMN